MGDMQRWSRAAAGEGRTLFLGRYPVQDGLHARNTILYGELWYSIDALRSDGIIDKVGNLTREYDAAAGNWGGEWRMPSSAEMEELFRECNIKTESDSSMLLEGPNGNTIMIHKTGYWTATAGRDSSLTARCFNDNGVALMERYSGLAVRPVCD